MKRIALLIFTAFVLNIGSFAQCAMCKANLESNQAAGGTVGTGVNNGILFLMGAVYLMIFLVGLFFYKRFRKREVV